MFERNGSSLYVQEIQRASLRNARVRNESIRRKDILECDIEKRILLRITKPAYVGQSKNRWYKLKGYLHERENKSPSAYGGTA